MVFQDGGQVGGVQPDGAREGAPAPFLPVTRRDRLLCALLASVAIVALVYAARALPDLSDALSEDEDDTPAVEQADGGNISPGTLTYGVDYESLRNAEVVYDEDTGEAEYQLQDFLPEIFGDFDADAGDTNAGAGESLGEWYDDGRVGYADGGRCGEVRAARNVLPRCHVCAESQDCRRRESVYRGSDESPGGYSDLESLCEGVDETGLSRIGLEDGDTATLELADVFRGGSDCLRSGVYRLGVDEPTVTKALWLGGVGVKTWCKFYNAFSRSAVGKKIERLGLAPILAACIGMGGMTAGNAATEALAIQEEAFYARTEAVLANAAIEADASEIAYAAMSRIVYNQTANIQMSASETAAAVADDIIVAVETGQLPTSANATWETAVAALMEGCLPADMVPVFSKFGSDLIDMFNLENPDEAVELRPYSDAEGFTVSGGGDFSGELGGIEFDYSDDLQGFEVVVNYKNGAVNRFGVSGQTSYIYYDKQKNIERFHFYSYNSSGQLGGSADWVNNISSITCGGDVVYLGDFRPNSYTMPSYENAPSGDRVVDFAGTADGVASFFDNGGQLVGQDAQFGDGGEILDYGNADISPVLYNDDYNPSTWAEILADLGVEPVNPGGENPSATDEVVAGENKGDAAGDATGKPKPGTSGSAPTVPRLQMQLDGTMTDLNGEVSQKFPFSIPYNVSTAVNMLVASPEAPHFTWVFALPTGNVEYEVDLSDFSPVAHVLRTMLDVLMVFCVISLLGKIAQVWGFFDKAAD